MIALRSNFYAKSEIWKAILVTNERELNSLALGYIHVADYETCEQKRQKISSIPWRVSSTDKADYTQKSQNLSRRVILILR